MTKKFKLSSIARNDDRYYSDSEDEDEGSKRKERKEKLQQKRDQLAQRMFPSKLGSLVLMLV
jgi:hypothetical protein